jgi:hypothetical protein
MVIFDMDHSLSDYLRISFRGERHWIQKAHDRFPGAGFGICAMLKLCR